MATPLMKRALKRTALEFPDAGQEPLPFFSEPATTPVIEEPVAQILPGSQARPVTFYDGGGWFVPRCACGAYGSFGVGVSLRHGREGTWWCGPCWREHRDSGAIP
jgi:hypothetical protein